MPKPVIYETLDYRPHDGVVTVTLDRPEQGNALDGQMKADLIHALRRAPQDGRALVLTGAGESFCAGQDLGDAPNLRDLDLGRTMREETTPLLMAMEECRVPILAAVNGAAAGAGMALALAADICIAAERARFAVISAGLGVAPDSGLSWWLPRLAGPARARGLAMLGEPLSAAKAARWGLIWDCAPDETFAAETARLAARLARAAPIGLRLTRAALLEGLENGFADQLEREAQLQAEAGRTRDFLEGALAWSEGRAPEFEGR